MSEIFSNSDLELCLGPALSENAVVLKGSPTFNASSLLRLAQRPRRADYKDAGDLHHPSRVTASLSASDEPRKWFQIHLGVSRDRSLPYASVRTPDGALQFSKTPTADPQGEVFSALRRQHAIRSFSISESETGAFLLKVQLCWVTPGTVTLNFQRPDGVSAMALHLFPFQTSREFTLPDLNAPQVFLGTEGFNRAD